MHKIFFWLVMMCLVLCGVAYASYREAGRDVQNYQAAWNTSMDVNKALANANEAQAKAVDKLAEANLQLAMAQIARAEADAWLARVGSGAIAIMACIALILSWIVARDYLARKAGQQ